MENTVVSIAPMAGRPSAKQPASAKQTTPVEYDFGVPERGSTGPRPLGEIMEPFQRIIDHPDRNRLMAEFFNRFW